jgi:BirA family transcriptional regulator, biotin operon repressor / biotin---[acetyl-CoA-carboxylase] ligase
MIIGSKLIFFETLPSTNNHAAQLLKKDNLREGTIVYANYQSAGRGYSSNKWHSEPGKNLLISTVLYPYFISPADEFSISMTISLGIYDFLARFTPGCSIKWPNDIYVNDDKIAGILIDGSISGNQIEYVIAGIGLNINQMEFPSEIPNPVSLRRITGIEYNLTECLEMLASDLDKRYKHLVGGEMERIREEYKLRLYRMNEWCQFKDNNGLYKGKILDVHDDGRIVIEKQNGKTEEYYFKETEFIQ